MTKKEILENSKSILALKNRINSNCTSEPELDETVREKFLSDSPNRRRFIESTLILNAASKEFRNVFGIEAPCYELSEDCYFAVDREGDGVDKPTYDSEGKLNANDYIVLNDPMSKDGEKGVVSFLDCWELINAAEFDSSSDTRDTNYKEYTNSKKNSRATVDNQRFFVDRNKDKTTSRYHSPICPPGFERWAGRYLYEKICKNFDLDEITLYKIFSDISENTIPGDREIFYNERGTSFSSDYPFDCVVDPSGIITKNKYSYDVDKEGEKFLSEGVLPVEYTHPDDAAEIIYYTEQVPVTSKWISKNYYEYTYDLSGSLFEKTLTPLVKFKLVKPGESEPFNSGYAILCIEPSGPNEFPFPKNGTKNISYYNIKYCINILTMDNEKLDVKESKDKEKKFLWWNWSKHITYSYRVLLEPASFGEKYSVTFVEATDADKDNPEIQLYEKYADNRYSPVDRNNDRWAVAFQEVEDEAMGGDYIESSSVSGAYEYVGTCQGNYEVWFDYQDITGEYVKDYYDGHYEYVEPYLIKHEGSPEDGNFLYVATNPQITESGNYVLVDGAYTFKQNIQSDENEMHNMIIKFTKAAEEDCLKYYNWIKEFDVQNTIPDADYSIKLMEDIYNTEEGDWGEFLGKLQLRYWYDVYEAKTFSETTTYNVGDYVIHRDSNHVNKLWICKATHTAGAWNNSHFNEVSETGSSIPSYDAAANEEAPTKYITGYEQKRFLGFLWYVDNKDKPITTSINKFNVTVYKTTYDPNVSFRKETMVDEIKFVGPSDQDLTKAFKSDSRKKLTEFVNYVNTNYNDVLTSSGIYDSTNNTFLGHSTSDNTRYDFVLRIVEVTLPVYQSIKRAETLNHFLEENDSLFKLAYSTISARIDKRTGTLRETCHILESVETAKQMNDKLKNDLKLLSDNISAFDIASGYGSKDVVIQLGTWENENAISNTMVRNSVVYILTDATKALEPEDIFIGKFIKAAITSVPIKVSDRTYNYKEATLVYDGGEFFVKNSAGEYVPATQEDLNKINSRDENVEIPTIYTRTVSAGPTYKITLSKELKESFRGQNPMLVKVF